MVSNNAAFVNAETSTSRPKKRKRDILTPSTTPNHKVIVVEGAVSEPLLEIYNISLSEQDISSLEQRNELNDQIIDYRLIHLERNLACEHTMVLTTKETTSIEKYMSLKTWKGGPGHVRALLMCQYTVYKVHGQKMYSKVDVANAIQ